MNELLGFDTSVAWPVALRVGPFALATSVVGLRSLPRAASVALVAGIAAAISPAAADLRGDAPLAIFVGASVAAGALVPLIAATMALEATARLGDLPRAWDTYFAVLVALSFLLMGGPAEVAAALVAPAPPRLPDVAAAGLVRGVMAGLAIAAPMLVGRLGVEVLFATTARAPLGTTYVVGRKLALWAIVALVARRLVFRAL